MRAQEKDSQPPVWGASGQADFTKISEVRTISSSEPSLEPHRAWNHTMWSGQTRFRARLAQPSVASAGRPIIAICPLPRPITQCFWSVT